MSIDDQFPPVQLHVPQGAYGLKYTREHSMLAGMFDG
jgi:hypothetical protein